MLSDIDKAIEQIKAIAKKAGGWITEKKVDKGGKVIIEVSITFKVDN